MTILASAPGKVVLLGEYVVLDGAKALVMAVDKRCTARLGRVQGERCRLTMRMSELSVSEFVPGAPTGSDLIDALLQAADFRPSWPAWSATIDSSVFYADGLKLGLGSSAAALVAFAGVSWTAAGTPGQPGLSALVHCHRAFQGGAGSGVDVAAALLGGSLEFTLNEDAEARIGSVRLPKSVGFAGVFTGESASTPGLVGRYRRCVDLGSRRVSELRQRMSAVASDGCAAVIEDDDKAFVAAIDAYGRCLAELGQEMGADLVTAAHRQIGDLAGEMGLAYKISGAGGGDIGIACGLDMDALQSFSDKATENGFRAVPLTVDEQGLRVEERAE